MQFLKKDELSALCLERASELVEISRKEVGDIFEAGVSTSDNVRLREKEYDRSPMHIWVFTSPHHNEISLDAPRYEEIAIKLARAYAAAGLGEFTVVGHY